MNIMFLIVKQSKPHEGVVRPFLNLARGLSEKIETSIALYECGHTLVEHVNESKISSIRAQSEAELFDVIKGQPPDFVVCDDNMASLRAVNSIGIGKMAGLVVYAQILYGIHSIAGCFDLSYLDMKDRIAFSVSKFIPFPVLRRRYVKALGNDKMVVANSKATANLLQTFYGVGVKGTVYPPIDTEVFRPSGDSKNPAAVTLYLGSRAGDTCIDFVRKIISRIHEKGCTVNLFGTEMLSSILKDDFPEANYFADLDDRQLAKMYSESLLTICPQKWETLGLVPIESMACGTPVLALNCMGHQETIIRGKTGLLADNNEEFLALLERSLTMDIGKFPEIMLRDYVFSNYSIPTCADQLIECLRKSV